MAFLLYEDEMDQMIGMAYAVRNELGAGWSEEIYHQAMVRMCKQQNVPFQSKPRGALIHRGVEIHKFEPDLVVRDKIILELKVHRDLKGKQFPKRNLAQILQYMKFQNIKVGMLMNFAPPKVGLKRVAFTPVQLVVEEQYEKMLPHVSEGDKQILREVQQRIVKLGNLYGLGYSNSIYRKLIAIELGHAGIDCIQDVNISAKMQSHDLGTHTTDCLLVANKFVLSVVSSLDEIPIFEYLRVRTYLESLGLKVGWVINFGRKKLQIHATIAKQKSHVVPSSVSTPKQNEITNP